MWKRKEFSSASSTAIFKWAQLHPESCQSNCTSRPNDPSTRDEQYSCIPHTLMYWWCCPLYFAYPNLHIVHWVFVPWITPITSLHDTFRALCPSYRLSLHLLKQLNPDRDLLLVSLKCETVIRQGVKPPTGIEELLESIVFYAQSRENQPTY